MASPETIIHNRPDCVSLVDACDILKNKSWQFEEIGQAIVNVSEPVALPHFETAHFVVLVGPVLCGTRHVVGLASSNRFRGLPCNTRETIVHPIGKLRDADVSLDGIVTLTDGTALNQVLLDRYKMPTDLTPRERLALAYCVSWKLGTFEVEFDTSYNRILDQLDGTEFPPLAVLVAHMDQVRRRNSALPSASIELFRAALWKCGLREPKRYNL